MFKQLQTIFDNAATSHGCTVDIEVSGEAPRVDNNEQMAQYVHAALRAHDGVTIPIQSAEFGASEDATDLMQAVKENDGTSAYTIVGTDHPTGHHTTSFDIDE